MSVAGQAVYTPDAASKENLPEQGLNARLVLGLYRKCEEAKRVHTSRAWLHTFDTAT